jgi:hypothetical protein
VPLPAPHAPTASGWSNSCRVGYPPPTGSTRPFHGARKMRASHPAFFVQIVRGGDGYARMAQRPGGGIDAVTIAHLRAILFSECVQRLVVLQLCSHRMVG